MTPTYPSYTVGLDLGQSQDYSALAIIEEPVYVRDDAARLEINAPSLGWMSPAGLTLHQVRMARRLALQRGRPERPPLHLRHLQRYPLGTPYPEIVSDVLQLMNTRALRDDAVLVVDFTGVGRGVVDQMRYAGLAPVAVSIHGGDSVTAEPGGFRAPKRELVTAVQLALQTERLEIAGDLPEAETLIHELLSFRAKLNLRNGHDSYEAWRERDHDDLVLAAALAVWYRDYTLMHWDQGAVRAFEHINRRSVKEAQGYQDPAMSRLARIRGRN
jgi:hypothetical protein